MDCDVIDVNSAPDQSAKESSYFMCMEVTYKCRLLWSFPSCFGRLCSHVAVVLPWLLHCSRLISKQST